MTASDKQKLLDAALKEAASIFPHPNPECEFLCEQLESLLEELQTVTGQGRRRIIILIAVLERQMRMLRCLPCRFE